MNYDDFLTNWRGSKEAQNIQREGDYTNAVINSDFLGQQDILQRQYDDLVSHNQQFYNAKTAMQDNLYNLAVASKNNQKTADLALLNQNRDYSQNLLDGQHKSAQKDAYINSEYAKYNLPAMLNAVGITGGASESALMDVNRGYQNALNNASNIYAQQSGELSQNHLNNTAQTKRQYAQLLDELMREYNSGKLADVTALQTNVLKGMNDYYDKSAAAKNSYNNSKLDAYKDFSANVNNRVDKNYQWYLDMLNANQKQSNWQRDFDLKLAKME